MSEQMAENDHVALTDEERLAISAVVHQNYYMPGVFAAVEHIIADRLTLAAIEARRADPEFMERVRSRVTVDAAIERGDIPGVGVLPESETLTQDERRSIGCDCVRLDDVWHHRRGCVMPAVERILAARRARPASVDAETLRQVAAELADWKFPDPDESRPHSAYRVALLERLHRYVGLLRTRADLAADGEPDGLRAKVEAEQRERIAQAVKALPTTRTQAWTKGWDSVSLADVLALLAHPATDQEEADRG